MELKQELIRQLLHLTRQAGEACLEIYSQDDFGIQLKKDNSPVTKADLKVNQILTEGLNKLTPDIPVISEEALVDYDLRKSYSRYWILDPIDGTKEFIKKTGEFTLNIGLVENQKPVFGIIYIPVLDEMFWGGQDIEFFEPAWRDAPGRIAPVEGCNTSKLRQGRASFSKKSNNIPEYLSYSTRKIRARSFEEDKLDITCSKDHRHPNDIKFIFNIGQDFYIKLIPCGSTIKICRIAEGAADIYIRTSGINDWDLAAGHAIIEGAGGHITTLDGKPLVYNTESQRLEPFIVHGDFQEDWTRWLPDDSN